MRIVSRNLFLLAALWLALGGVRLSAQTARDRAVELTAVVQDVSPRITLQWNAAAHSVTQQRVSRRLKGDATWTLLATVATSATSYADTTAASGVIYEYRVSRTYSNNNPAAAYGYLHSGVRVPLVADRGRVILLVDETMAAPLATELTRFAADLTGDGWTVLRADVSRTALPPAARANIQALYNASPSTTRAVILFGHIPVPYSGNEAMDGHPDHSGAWPADVYYGDMNGVWTDSTVNNPEMPDPRNRNVPGDGKFDQIALPSDVELQVGRIDLANLPAFGVSETELLRQYLDRDHAYRHRLGTYVSVGKRALVDDNFHYFEGEAFAVTAWRSFTPCVGAGNVQELDWFGTLQNESFLWAYGCGGGTYYRADGVGSTNDFVSKDSRAVFTVLFGSYFGDWDNSDAFLRAPLAGTPTSLGLVSCWAGRPHWFFHPMALGETVGYSARLTQNNSGTQQGGYDANYAARYHHIALHGDPTLRLYPVAPAKNLTASGSANAVTLNWTASTDGPIEGYAVARASSAAGPFVAVPGGWVSGTTLVDGTVTPGESYVYLVRAVKLETSPAGSYFNSSQGAFSAPVMAAESAGITIYPPAVNRSINPGSATTETLTVSNPALGTLEHTISPSNASSWLSLNATAGTVPPGGVQQIEVTLHTAGLEPGDYYAELIIDSNAEGQASVSIPVYFTVGNTPVQNWRLLKFGNVADEGDGADTANRDGDAGDNLLEYALGREPLTPETAALTAIEINASGNLEMRFERDPTRTDLRFFIEATSDLTVPWTPIASSIHGAPVIATGAHSVVETDAGGVKAVVVEDSAPAASFPRRYLRLRVVRD